ncbi:MAG: hypothetical protein IKN49_01175 [Elusimicrobiaceae bacterium]|nr:hypothetical protein [Elusimicrobiaceae bacterium]
MAEALTNAASLQKAIDVWLLENGYPTSDANFLGNNTNASGQLVVNLESGMDCNANSGEACAGKNFSYTAACSILTCYIQINRISSTPYYIAWVKQNDTWSGDECNYTDESPIGEKICKMLEAQGNGFFACKDC